MIEILKADLHIHPDGYKDPRSGNKRHGEDPRIIARAILDNRINVAAITPHNAVTTDFLEVRAEIERLQTTTRFEAHPTPQILLGTEINTTFKGQSYHLVTVFKNPDFTRHNLPDITFKGKGIPFSEFEDLKKDYECLIFVAHPFSRNKNVADANKTRSLIRDNVIDAYEAINGSAFHNILTAQGTLRHKRNKNKSYRKTLHSYALGHKKPISKAPLGNSDGHRGHIIGTAYTEYVSEQTTAVDDLFHAIKIKTTTPILKLSTYEAVVKTIRKRALQLRNTSRHPGN